MRYKLFVSNETEYWTFYEENKKKAMLLFQMAKYSNLFSYVSLNECFDEEFLLCDWEDEVDEVDV